MGLFKPNIEKLEKKKDVKGLVKALNYKHDKWIRYYATETLGVIGDTQVVEPLIQALNDKNHKVREKAASALGKIGDKSVVKPLIHTLKDKYSSVRWESALSLGMIGDTRAAEPLIQALKDKDSLVRNGAAKALGKMKDIRAVDPLINTLTDEDESSDNLEIIAWALGNIGDTRAVEPLTQTLKYYFYRVREESAKALGNIGDARAIDPLIKALADEVDDVQKSAALALGKIGDKKAIEPLINWLFTLKITITQRKILNYWTRILNNLFGDYTSLLIKASIFIKCKKIHLDLDHIDKKYYLKDSNNAVRKLCKIPTQISSNILHKVSKKKNIKIDFRWTCGSPWYGKLSYKIQRTIAKEELERRGNPPYDPSAYLVKDAWKL